MHPSSPSSPDRAPLNLGLIGDGIGRSRAPRFHELAGLRKGLVVRYRLHDLGESSLVDFDKQFDDCIANGYVGFNVTHPYKGQVIERVRVIDPYLQAIGAINTVVVSGENEPFGYNTDCSGFVFGWRRYARDMDPGRVVILGAGGAGRAISFALLQLNVRELRIVDLDVERANRLQNDLRALEPLAQIEVMSNPVAALGGVDGMVNATPVGMAKSPGMPIEAALLTDLQWVFDAVYTPERTALIRAAERLGVTCLSGFGMFLGQGVDAFRHFTGLDLSRDDIGYIEATIRHDISRTEA